MRERRAALERRREQLQNRSSAQREIVSLELDSIGSSVERLDHYLAVARRLRPLLIVGGLALLVVMGPRRVVSLARGSFVGSLMLRQLLGRR
jgi:hypothetical protein